jgi:ABC-type transport system substrate-binding protein
VDVANDLPIRQSSKFLNKLGYGINAFYLVLKQNGGSCEDDNIRKAIDFGINRDAIIEAAGINKAQLLPDYHLYPILNDPQYRCSKENYNQKMANAWWLAASDDLRNRVLRIGSSMENDPKVKKIIPEVENQLRRIGFSVERSDDKRELDISVEVMGFAEPSAVYLILASGNVDRPWYYANDRVDHLLNNPKIGMDRYKEIQHILLDEHVLLPLFRYKIAITYTKDLRIKSGPSVTRSPNGYDVALWEFE